MKKTLAVITLALYYFTLSAQLPRKVVVEHFTNTLCSICAARNPAFYQTLGNYPQVLHIAFHPSSPYQGCYFSQQNKAENDARTNYYSIYGATPRVVVQGKVLPSANPAINNAALDTVINGTAPMDLEVSEYSMGADSVAVTITIRTAGVVGVDSVALFAGVTENPVNYNAANGENVHYDVFRKALTAVTGTIIAVPTVGDSLVIQTGYRVANTWLVNNLATIAWVQQISNKQIINAAKSNGVNTATGINANANVAVVAYPNPAKDVLVLSGVLFTPVEVYNTWGQKVLLANTGANATIQIAALPAGIYIAKAGNVVIKFARQ